MNIKNYQVIGSFLLLAAIVGTVSIYKPLTGLSPRTKTASVNLSYTGFAGPAELPRAYVDTTMPTQTGKTWTIAAGDAVGFQNALDNSLPGDTIILQSGSTYTGNFHLKPKSNPNNQWIVIKSSGTIPAEGVRVQPSNASQLARVQTGVNYNWTITADPGSSYYRLIGLEITVDPSLTDVNSIVLLGATDATTALPDHLILDRDYIHGTDTLQNRRCVNLNSSWTAIIDSYISQCENTSYDTQAIAGGNGPGPYKIHNNYLEGVSENIAFGGFTPARVGNNPADIEVSGNYIKKPLSWNPNSSTWDGITRWIKNLVEFKAGVRVLMEGNVLENSWVGSQQYGYGFVFWSANAGCTWCTASDITIRNNKTINVVSPFDFVASYDSTTIPMTRVYVANNVDYGTTPPVDSGWRYFQDVGVNSVTFVHNTGFNPGTYIIMSPEAPAPNLVFQDNIGGNAVYNLFSSGGQGTTALSLGTNNQYIFTNNVLVGGTSPEPANNSYPADIAGVGFTNPSAGDYHLSASSPYLGTASDGTNPGADIDYVNWATRGAVSGVWDNSAPPTGTTPPPVTNPGPVVSVSANPTSITSGQSSTISWSSTNATSCSSSQLGSTLATSGSQTVTPLSTTTYSVTCTGSGGSATQSVVVTVGSATSPAPTVSLSANPTSITSGQSSVISWSSSNATSCSSSQLGSTLATSGSQTVTPLSTTTYTVSCTGADGTAANSATVSVSTPTTTPPPTGLSVGDWIQLTQKTNVRQQPATGGKPLGSQDAGAKGQILAGPQNGSGYTWYDIDYQFGADGWSIQDYMQKIAAPAPIGIGTRVTTTSRVNVRSGPGLSYGILGKQTNNSSGSITQGPVSADGYTWWYVDFDSGVDGWVAGANLTD